MRREVGIALVAAVCAAALGLMLLGCAARAQRARPVTRDAVLIDCAARLNRRG